MRILWLAGCIYPSFLNFSMTYVGSVGFQTDKIRRWGSQPQARKKKWLLRCCSTEDVKEMNRALKRTCRAIVLMVKSFLSPIPHRRRLRGLQKVLIKIFASLCQYSHGNLAE